MRLVTPILGEQDEFRARLYAVKSRCPTQARLAQALKSALKSDSV